LDIEYGLKIVYENSIKLPVTVRQFSMFILLFENI